MSASTIPRNQILTGDALDRLRSLPDKSIDSVVTSPPYFRLRNYGVSGQLGLEPHITDWVGELRTVMKEIARVLVPTGSVWLNLGDSFSTRVKEGAPRKSLLFGPERLALALIDDGWTIRNKIVWAKTTNVPSSVTDRFSTHYEVVYLLTRSVRYYFDLDSLRLPHTSRPPKPRDVAATRSRPAWLGPNSDGDSGLAALHARGIQGHPLGKNPGDVWRLGVSQFRGAHFATFPETLAKRMVEAGTPRMRCSQCRAPWTRRLIREGDTARRTPPRPTCTCDAKAEPGLVLDPFIGSGTTAITAARLGRDWLGVELNPEFVDLATTRIHDALHR
ncbi:DNA methylase N-4 [Aeromicrobium sp. Root344]|uniref:DNA-methyltransferase n=1 Tax=Aeromicrobium sp. Root344 TaxID=1736521 RepID=UPI0007017BD7|nr:site-specific DNA-methyltransferase [Aeromicrobium sp. Root344]KQV73880.1 DNA methylase N-4 [Aeromicrobium sp. Root344]